MFPENRFRPIRREGVYKETLTDESVLIDPKTDTIYALNATAALIWDHCDGNHHHEEIADKILVRYDATRAQVENDVRQILERLFHLGLIALDDQSNSGRDSQRKERGS